MTERMRFPGIGRLILMLLAVGAFFWAANQDGLMTDGRGSSVPEPMPKAPQQIAYTANGPSGEAVNITYTNSTGGTDEIGATLPWSYTFTLPVGGEYLSLAVHRNRTHAGSVRATIAVNGQIITEAYTNDSGGSALTSEYVE